MCIRNSLVGELRMLAKVRGPEYTPRRVDMATASTDVLQDSFGLGEASDEAAQREVGGGLRLATNELKAGVRDVLSMATFGAVKSTADKRRSQLSSALAA